MKYNNLAVPVLMVLVAFLSTCSPGDPSSPQLPPFEIEGVVVINEEAEYTPQREVELRVLGAGADSVLVWNGTVDDSEGGTWFLLDQGGAGTWSWDLDSTEGLQTVNVRFRRNGHQDSDVFSASITLDTTPPDMAAEPVFPGSYFVPNVANLQWSAGEDALCPESGLQYVLLFGTSGDPSEVIWQGPDTSHVVQELEPSTEYYWRISVTDAAGNTSTGPVWSLTTWDQELPEFSYITPGTFVMGSPESELGRAESEIQHTVTLTNPFYMATTEVVFGQYMPALQWAYEQGLVTEDEDGSYDNVNGSGDVIISTELYSVIYLEDDQYVCTKNLLAINWATTWYGAAAYCDWLNQLSGFPTVYNRNDGWNAEGGDIYEVAGFRLPTEAEWEYACRAGSTTAFANGPITGEDCWDPVLDEIGWYCGNYHFWHSLPGEKIPNAWGLYDMHGGFGNYCFDWRGDYPSGPVENPVNVPSDTMKKIIRGRGPDYCYPRKCRSAYRFSWSPDALYSLAGFRLVLALED
jgi:formylglycine-generating enzyme required for sulfatase activity